MILKVTETKVKEVEVELPLYRKSICHFWKVISENKSIKVTDLFNNYEIASQNYTSAFDNDNEDSTEEEFINAYNRVLNELKY